MFEPARIVFTASSVSLFIYLLKHPSKYTAFCVLWFDFASLFLYLLCASEFNSKIRFPGIPVLHIIFSKYFKILGNPRNLYIEKNILPDCNATLNKA